MATFYRQQTADASIDEGRIAPYSTLIRNDIQPDPALGGRKLLDQFRDKMRTLHYALATEKAYRHWIVELLRFHRDGDNWKHPATLGKPEIEAVLTHLATQRSVSAKTQNQAFSAGKRRWTPFSDETYVGVAIRSSFLVRVFARRKGVLSCPE